MYAYGGNTHPSGVYNSPLPAINASPGTGNGGNGSAGPTSGNGGSGVVVLAIPTNQYQFIVNGAPPSIPVAYNQSAGLTYVTFSSPGTFTIP
jgi:hypothetical protein